MFKALASVVRRLGLFLPLLCLLFVRSGSWAAPVSAQQAEKAVQGWLKTEVRPFRADMGGKTGRLETYKDAQGQANYYIVHLAPSGYVVVSADDLAEPIVAFCSAAAYDPSVDSPLGALVSRDLRGRMAVAREGAAGAAAEQGRQRHHARWLQLDQLAAGTGLIASLGGVSDVRVAPLIQSQWGQQNVLGSACYNYYTPSGDPCGCVATAMAQLMRFYQFPASGIGVSAFTITVAHSSRTAYTRGGDGSGGPYAWSQMTLIPGTGVTTAGRQAIGALCYDAGVSVNMDYTATSSGASDVGELALINTFGYSNAIQGYNSGLNLSQTDLNAMINPNLDASYPVLLGILGSAGGHAIVADGYGYSNSTLYHHLNMGWDGQENVWYNLPNIDSSPSFPTVFECAYNVYTSGSGEIISGRVLDSAGTPVAGATVTAQRTGGGTYAATTGSNGIYALAKIPSSSTYLIQVSLAGQSFTDRSVSTGVSLRATHTAGNQWGIDFAGSSSAAPAMQVTPSTGLAASGSVGGPFSPVSTTYTVTNTGTAALSWTAGKTASWVSLSKTGGSLAVGASDTVVVSINTAANSLTVGTYGDTVTFTNTTNGAGDTTRSVSLTAVGAAALQVTATAGLSSTGAGGGPFSPVSTTYTVSNPGTATLSWTAGKTASWVSLSKTGGSLAIGASDTVVVSINSGASSLAAGSYTDTVTFTNTTNGTGNTTRSVSLTAVGAAALQVTATAGLASTGAVGGPFSPVSTTYTVTNTGTATMSWTAGKTASWVSLSKTGGSLAAGASDTVVVSINGMANGLADGTYSDTVTFTNTTNGSGNTTRSVSLAAVGAAVLQVTTTAGLASTGYAGGPFSPVRTTYIVANTGTAALSWTAGKTASWVSVSNAGGSLAVGASDIVVVSINTVANSLAAGSYGDTATFTNTTNHAGDTTRSVSLTVAAAPGSLLVSPAGGLSSNGGRGGPFAPASTTYTLSNPGGTPVAWSAENTQAWVSLSKTSGTLNANASDTVTVTIGAGAAALGYGLYADTVNFTNRTNGSGSTSRGLSLSVVLVGDADNDGLVSILDVLRLVQAFGTSEGGVGFDPACDLDHDGTIGMSDVMILLTNFGRTMGTTG